MVNVSYPGVYIQEVPSGVHTIAGVSTSIAAFFGRTAKGPLNKAVRILSPSDFVRIFGGPHPHSDLGQSVRQFFDNGGSDCYIVRLAHGAQPADVTLRNLADRQNVLTVTAKSAGLWGNGIRLVVDYDTPNPDDTFNLHVFHEEAGRIVNEEHFTNLSMMPTSPRFARDFVTQSSSLIDVELHSDMGDPTDSASFINNIINTPAGYSQSRRPFITDTSGVPSADCRGQLTDLFAATGRFEISVNEGRFVEINLTSLNLNDAVNATEVAARIADAIESQLDAGTLILCQWDTIGHESLNQGVLRLTPNSPPYTSVRIRRARRNDLAVPMMLGVDQGGIEVVRYSNMRPVCTGTVFMGGSGTGDFTNQIDLLSGLPLNAINSVSINGSLGIPVDVVTTGMDTSDLWYQQPDEGTDGVRQRLNILARAVTDDPDIPWRGEVWGYHLVFIKTEGSLNDVGAVDLDGAGDPEDPDTLTNLSDGFIANVRRYSLGSMGTSNYQSLEDDLPGPNYPGTPGNDGEAPEVADYLGNEALQTGFYALDDVDLFNIMVLPGDREVTEENYLQIIGPASIYCEQNRAFLLIDAPVSWTRNNRPVATNTEINGLRSLVVSDHSAVFYPQVQYSDRGIKREIGPSGVIAGLMARIDSTRGVWKAPAGIEADIRGVLDLEVNLTDSENGVLNQLGVNCLRKFPNGIVNWGARTMAGFASNSDTEWKYVPIRRFALFLEESLYRGTKWVVFEPNDEPLWAQIRLNINAFMMGLFRRGAFQGSTPDQAYFVKCDGETTTQNDRNQGIVNIEVGFAPLKPAEFVIIRIQQIAGELG